MKTLEQNLVRQIVNILSAWVNARNSRCAVLAKSLKALVKNEKDYTRAGIEKVKEWEARAKKDNIGADRIEEWMDE